MKKQQHWENIYTTKAPTEVSWYQAYPELSLDLIDRSGVDKSGYIIDVGGGESTLIDFLLKNGYEDITVLDISASALNRTKARLEEKANLVTWIEADITKIQLPYNIYDIWHDRAVFHFLTDKEDRQRYIAAVKYSLKSNGRIIVATFAPDGPPRCSGLDIVRYKPETLHSEFGEEFELLDSRSEIHQTPFGTQQKFIYCYCRKILV